MILNYKRYGTTGRKELHDIGYDNFFEYGIKKYTQPKNKQIIKATSKVKHTYTLKETINRVKRQPMK